MVPPYRTLRTAVLVMLMVRYRFTGTTSPLNTTSDARTCGATAEPEAGAV